MKHVANKPFHGVLQGLLLALLIGAAVAGCSRSSSGGGGLNPFSADWSDQPGGELLWSVDDLANAIRSGMAGLVVVDCRFDEAEGDPAVAEPFDDGHIKGAIWIDWRDISDEIPVEFPPEPEVDEFLGEKRGMFRTDTIVLYGDGALNQQAPFRMFWMLRSYGCRDVHIVDGGLTQWIAKGYDQDPALWEDTDWTAIEAGIVPNMAFGSQLDTSDLAVGTGVQDAVENNLTTNKIIIDARTPWEFSGEATEKFQARSGRIPHSVNLWWVNTIDEDTGLIKSPQQVINLFNSVGAGPGKEIIAVATTGVRSTVIYFLCELLGYNCKVYQGGLYNWASLDTPPGEPSPYVVERTGPYDHKSVLVGEARPEYAAASAVLDNRVFLFGGIYYDPADKVSKTSDTIWRFDPGVSPQHEGAATTCWEKQTLTLPAPIFGMAAAADPANNSIYLFGGRNAAGAAFRTVIGCQIDPGTMQVTHVVAFPNVLPESLTGAAACTAGGDIYLFGGSTDSTAAGATAEAYKIIPGAPPTIDDAAVPPLPSARSQCGAAVLDGKVYCIGGMAADETLLDEVLVFDPANPGLGWVPVDSLNLARASLQAAAACGRIYVCGGMIDDPANGFEATANCESFAPGEGWINESPMKVAKFDHCVAGVGGSRIFLFGGYNFPSSGKLNGADFLNVVEFRPAGFSNGNAMPGAQDSGASVVINGKIYIFGGTQGGAVTARVLEYDPAADSYRLMDPIPYGAVRGPSAAAVGGYAIVCGGAAGIDPPNPVKSVAKFEPDKLPGSQWTELPADDMPYARYSAAVAYFNDAAGVYSGLGLGQDLLFVIGGKDWSGVTQDTTFIYGVNRGWDAAAVGLLPRARNWSAAAVINDMLYVTGGAGQQGYPLSDTLVLDLTQAPTSQWQYLTAMPTPRYGHSTAVIGDRFYNIAGFTPEGGERGVTGAVEIFDAGRGRWEIRPALKVARGLSFAGASNGQVFVIGGFASSPIVYFDDTIKMMP